MRKLRDIGLELHLWFSDIDPLNRRRRLVAELPPGSDTEHVWLAVNGRKRGKHLSLQGVWELLRHYANHVGISKRVYPQRFPQKSYDLVILNDCLLSAVPTKPVTPLLFGYLLGLTH